MAQLWNFRLRKRRTNQYPVQRNGMAASPKIAKLTHTHTKSVYRLSAYISSYFFTLLFFLHFGLN